MTRAANDIVERGFSYSSLTQEEADIARHAADGIRGAMQRSIREVGALLLKAKAAMPHGSFSGWCETEVGITPRSAQNYMHTARWLQGKSERLSSLPATVLYELSSPKADQDVVAAIVDAATAGSPFGADEVKQRLWKAELEAKEISYLARRAPKATPEQLKAKLRKQRAEHKAQSEREKQEREDSDKVAYADCRPFADRVARVLVSDSSYILNALPDWRWKTQFFEALTDAFRDQRDRS